MKPKLLPAFIASAALIITIASAALIITPFAVAANYQSELSATYADVDNGEFSEDGYLVGLAGKYYFSPVETKNHPLAEAAFIEKASNLYVELGNLELKGQGSRTDIYSRTLGVDFYIPNSVFYVGAGVNEQKFKYSAPVYGGESSQWDSVWFVKAGVAPLTGLLVWSEFTEDVDPSDEWNINGKYVLPLVGEQALNVEASYEKSDITIADDTITGAVDYYLDSNLSFGAGFVNTSYAASIDKKSTTDYFVRARNFFTDNISGELAYTDGQDENALTIGATLRF
jgi:hypothetical protein